MEVACAAVAGEVQICLIKSDGRLFHGIRHGDNTWAGLNDAAAAGVQNAIIPNAGVACAEVAGALHVCLVKQDGRLFHAIRVPDGNWQGFNDASGIPNAGPRNIAVACAGFGAELQVCVVKDNGRMYHAIRRADGSWAGFNDASGIQNVGADNVHVACANVANELHVCLVKKSGKIFHAIRHSDATGSWAGFNDASGIQNVGSDNVRATCAGAANELHVGLVKTSQKWFHAIRHLDGSWAGFNDATFIQNGANVARAAFAGIGGTLFVALGNAPNPDLVLYGLRAPDGGWGTGFAAQPPPPSATQVTTTPPPQTTTQAADPHGVSTITVVNTTTDDTITVWIVDEINGEYASVDLAPTEQTTTGGLTDNHKYYVSAISHTAVAKHNTDKGETLDPKSATLYNVADFQRAASEVMADPAGGDGQLNVP